MNIGIINYGMGNLASVRNCLKRLDHDSTIVSSSKEILSCDALILPGVGAFSSAMKNLTKQGLIKPLESFVQKKQKPLILKKDEVLKKIESVIAL